MPTAIARAMSSVMKRSPPLRQAYAVRAVLPDQPEDGFTVSTNETQEQIDLLCNTYETGDDEAKRMTRMIAELSVTR